MSDSSLINNPQSPRDSSTSTAVGHDIVSTRPWIRFYEQGVPAHLDIPDYPLTWLLDQAVKNYPGHTALIYYGTKISYAQLSTLANRFAVALQKLGIQKGDRVAIALPNIPQYPIAFYGALRAGAVAVPTNPLYTGREMQHQLADSGARFIVMMDEFYPTVRSVRAETALEHVILTSPADYLPPLLRRLYPLSQRRTKRQDPHLTNKELHEDQTLHTMSEMLVGHAKKGLELFNLPALSSGDDLAILQYTGGTTGLSKGAMLTHRNLLANAMQTRNWTPRVHDATEVTLCVTPFFHAYGSAVGKNLSILAADLLGLFHAVKAKDVVKTISRYRPTLMPGIPTMYLAIMREAGERTKQLSSIKYCISGAAPLPAKVRIDFETITHGKLVEGYGLSEAGPVTHCNPLNGDFRDGSIGLPLPNVDAALLDQKTGVPVPVGQEGEIAVKGPNIMQGYWKREEETAGIFDSAWMRTGDVGKMDEDGYFYVLDRAKDMIIASGFNVYPREVEEVWFLHPSVQEAAVVGVPDEYRGATVAAFVVLTPGSEAVEGRSQAM